MAVQAGGHPDAVAQEYGVSRASVYNWTKDYQTQGVKGLIHVKGDRRFASDGMTSVATIRFVKVALQRDPSYSADSLSDRLSELGMEISSRTLRNIFKRLGVSTTEQRLANAFKPDNSDISVEDLDAIIRELEDGPAGELSGRRPGNVMVQDRVKFPKGFCDEPLAIEIIVDTFASSKRIYAMLASPSHQLAVDAFSEVRRIYEKGSLRIHKVCTPRKQQYCEGLGAFAYPQRFKKPLDPILEVRGVNSKFADSRIKAAWSTLQSQWLKSLHTRLALKDMNPKQIEDDLEDWLVAHRK